MKKLRKLTLCSLVSILVLAPLAVTTATELVWHPINPSFVGGNYLNASWLLSSAQAQNSHVKSTGSSYRAKDPIEEFEEDLNRELLSRLGDKIIKTAFGEDFSEGELELKDGEYNIGDYTITVDSSGDSINIQIDDGSSATIIDVPYY